MKKVFLMAVAMCLMIPLGMAQNNEVSPYTSSPAFQSVAPSSQGNRALGDYLWTIDVGTPTGDIRCLGVEFDGTDFWVTGAYDMTIAYLHQLDANGGFIQSYPQPATNWGFWGWRDLAYDGTYLYAGDDSTMPGYITEIDPATGSVTGTNYGPFPVVPCRALAYETKDDAFWTGSWNSMFYECHRDNSYSSYSNFGLAGIYGACTQEATAAPLIYWWTQDGNGELATEFDPDTGMTTGPTFDGVGGGIAGGACAYDDAGAWILVGMSQASPDTISAYDLGTGAAAPLAIDNDEIESWNGGTVNFTLDATAANAGRQYLIVGSVTGDMPGTPLPGGMTVLPINWDIFTNMTINFAGSAFMPNTFGNLDGNGQATAQLIVPIFTLAPGADFTMTFAYCLNGKPWDFASNPVFVDVLAPGVPPTEYKYDNGSSENLLGWTAGGEMCWMHYFEVPAAGTDTIESVSTAYGSPAYPGFGPGNGSPSEIFIWEDPTDDSDPYDCVYLDGVSTTIANVDTDTLNVVMLNSPQMVTAGFWVGANVDHAAGQFVAPIDMDTGSAGEAWVAGDPGGTGGGFDEMVIGNNGGVYEMGSIGLPNVFLLRAQPQ